MAADDDRWSPGVDPAADARANYDYVAGEGHRPALVVAPGASCRTQLADRAGSAAPTHPIECLASSLSGPRQS